MFCQCWATWCAESDVGSFCKWCNQASIKVPAVLKHDLQHVRLRGISQAGGDAQMKVLGAFVLRKPSLEMICWSRIVTTKRAASANVTRAWTPKRGNEGTFCLFSEPGRENLPLPWKVGKSSAEKFTITERSWLWSKLYKCRSVWKTKTKKMTVLKTTEPTEHYIIMVILLYTMFLYITHKHGITLNVNTEEFCDRQLSDFFSLFIGLHRKHLTTHDATC